MSDDNKTSQQLAALTGKFEERGKRLDAIDSNISGIRDELREMNTTLAKNTEQLIIHIKRTELNERHILAVEKQVEKRIKPLEKHATVVQTYGKILLLLAGAPAAVYYIGKIITEFLVK